MNRVIATFHQTVDAFSSITEINDPYTSNHQRRVTKLSLEIAKRLGFNDDQLEALYFAAMLHDLGKLYIPMQILNKSGKLTHTEFELIKTHVELGVKVVEKIDFPWPIKEIIAQHHERLDGSGYPLGLKKDDILLEAQIIAVADSMESMLSHRPYRPSLGQELAIKNIMDCRGVRLNADVVDLCLEILNDPSFDFDT